MLIVYIDSSMEDVALDLVCTLTLGLVMKRRFINVVIYSTEVAVSILKEISLRI